MVNEFLTNLGDVVQMLFGFLAELDSGILLFIQEHLRFPAFTPFVTFITKLGNAGMIWIIISLLLLVSKKTRRIGLTSILALLFSLLINNVILKTLAARMRPYDAVKGLTNLIERQVDYSFPSGHTGSSFASACVLYRGLSGAGGTLAVVLAVLISLSRLYVGVHYPSDVFVGMLTGILSSYLAEWAVGKIHSFGMKTGRKK